MASTRYPTEYSAKYSEYSFCPYFGAISFTHTHFLFDSEYSDEYSFEFTGFSNTVVEYYDYSLGLSKKKELNSHAEKNNSKRRSGATTIWISFYWCWELRCKISWIWYELLSFTKCVATFFFLWKSLNPLQSLFYLSCVGKLFLFELFYFAGTCISKSLDDAFPALQFASSLTFVESVLMLFHFLTSFYG